jgi:hypothetical protein
MKRICLTMAAVGTFSLIPPTAWGQQALTVGDLLDKGAKKLTREEIRTLYTGATASGVQAGKPEVYIPKQAFGRWFGDR